MAHRRDYKLNARQQILFEAEMTWAEQIAARMSRHLPPCFDLEELQHFAVLGLIKAAQRFKPGTRGKGFAQDVPFRAFARVYVRGEVNMGVRRRNYTEATHEELEDSAVSGAEEGRVYGRQVKAELSRAIKLLPPGVEADVVRYLYQHEMSREYAAAVLSLTLEELDAAHGRAVAMLRERMVRK